MKKFVAILISSMFFLILGCLETVTVESILGGEHQLRRMVTERNLFGNVSGGFFLFVGGIDGKIGTKTEIKFAWLMNDGVTYAISSLPIEKIRIRFDEKTTTPTIMFHFDTDDPVPADRHLQHVINSKVQYAIIKCKESDWPVNIKMPLQ